MSSTTARGDMGCTCSMPVLQCIDSTKIPHRVPVGQMNRATERVDHAALKAGRELGRSSALVAGAPRSGIVARPKGLNFGHASADNGTMRARTESRRA